jgi:hypothetical protein
MDLRDKIYTLIALVGLFLLLGVLNVFLSDYHMRIDNCSLKLYNLSKELCFLTYAFLVERSIK